MESSQEASPAPSISSKSLPALAKARIARKADSTTGSIKEVEAENERSVVRNSVDSLLERTRSRQASKDDGLPSGPSNLSKLVPGRVKKKKKRREEAERAQKEADEGRGRPAGDQAATSALTSPTSQNRSLSTLGDGEDSLVTFDSEPDSPVATRPDAKSRDSHIGYLTTSSPLIKTTEPSDVPSLPLSQEPVLHTPSYAKSNTIPIENSSANVAGGLSPNHSATFDTRRSSQASMSRSRSRGVSPAAKIRDVFSKSQRKKSQSPTKSPAINTQAELPKHVKSPSVVGQDATFSDSASSLNIPDASNSKPDSIKDVPAIKTTPHTPPNGDIAPETTVTPPTPTDHRRASQGGLPRPLSGPVTNPNIVVSPTGNMISHRRVRSDSATASNIPTKLSQSIPPPMTPMAEETRTPGGTVRTSSSGSAGPGFFSSVFSAAQNMTSTLTSTIANPNRSRSSTATNEESKATIEELPEPAAEQGDEAIPEIKKPLAIDTLGSGELRLSHLGISSESLISQGNGAVDNEKAKSATVARREEATAKADDASAARAVSAAYSEQPNPEAIATETPAGITQRSVSMYAPTLANEAGEKTPPTGSIYEGADSIRRSGSVRSRVGQRVRRHRNSSSATGNTVGTTVVAPARSPGSQPSGFAVASKKRNREFRQLFKSVPEDDFLIEDYSCALQKEIIIAGRIYISESHICFSSNILGWITTLVISFNEVVSMEKENTAVVFPNAIAIQTLHARHTFRSLLSRDSTYELLVGIWKLTHPNLKVSGNGTRLDPDAEKVEKADPSGSDDMSDLTEGEEVYDEDQDEDDGTGSPTENGGGSVTGSLNTDNRGTARKASAMGIAAGSAAVPAPISGEAKAAEKAASAGAAVDSGFPGPAAHAPTTCPDGASHLDKELQDDIIPAPLGKVYSMVFGPASGGFMARWLVDDMKCSDLKFEDDAKNGINDQVKSRSMSYIKPLYAPIGPKTTTCLVTETVDFFDLEKAVCITASTQTPDVPSGNVFVTKTHFCFMWAPNNQTRAIMNYKIEWTGKSWLKGPIEKGATDGQTTYCVELLKALKAGIASPRSAGAGTKGRTKTGGKRAKGATTMSKPSDEKNSSTKTQPPNWGVFEPIRPILSPVTDIFAPFITQNMIIGFLVFVILFNYLRSPKASTSTTPYLYSSDQAASYEATWRREEAGLWDWLDERIGVRPDTFGPAADQAKDAKALKGEKKQKVLQDAKMAEREIERTIEATEAKLERLKRKMKANTGADGGEDGRGNKAGNDGAEL